MPIHSYNCVSKKCGHEFDVFYTSQSAVEKEEPGERCPKCGGLRKKRLPPKGTSHVFKSGKWFKQGY